VLVDNNGFLIAVMVTIACVHDSKAAYLLARCLKELCCNIKVLLAYTGYRGEVSEKKEYFWIFTGYCSLCRQSK
jgi:putative transposase